MCLRKAKFESHANYTGNICARIFRSGFGSIPTTLLQSCKKTQLRPNGALLFLHFLHPGWFILILAALCLVWRNFEILPQFSECVSNVFRCEFVQYSASNRATLSWHSKYFLKRLSVFEQHSKLLFTLVSTRVSTGLCMVSSCVCSSFNPSVHGSCTLSQFKT